MSSTNFNSNHGLGELGVKAVKLEQDFFGRPLQQNENTKFDLTSHEESNSLNRRHETEKVRRSTILKTPNSGASVFGQEQSPIDDSSLCSTSSICPAPICRQFWKAGNYDDRLNLKPTCQNGTGYLRIHPKFLHSNATSHKWAFGAMAELLDNSVDEIQNGATFVIVDKTSNPRDGTPALLIQDDGGGMDPEAMRRCLSFGFSDKKSKNAIGQYGNGFKTSSMRLGADVVVFSRCERDRRLTQSVGLLSYTFLMQTRQDRIVVPMVDYQFDTHSGTWNTLHNEQHLKNNLSILLQWSPVATEAELLKQCDDIGPHGTKIIVYNLWCNDEGKLELDFESDPEDIRLSGKGDSTAKVTSRTEASEQHLANRLHYSLRAYLSILYLRVPEKFCILLRGRGVEYHNIANDLKFPNSYCTNLKTWSALSQLEVLNTYPYAFASYSSELSLAAVSLCYLVAAIPFYLTYACRSFSFPGAGSALSITFSAFLGQLMMLVSPSPTCVLEANFVEPTHNKQDFEKTPVFQKLETRLKEMTQEYWDYHCGLLGYQVKKTPRPNMISHVAPNSRLAGAIRHEVSTPSNHVAAKSGRSVPSIHQNTPGAAFKRKGHDHVELKRVKRMGVIGSGTVDSACGGDVQVFNVIYVNSHSGVNSDAGVKQRSGVISNLGVNSDAGHAVDPAKQLEDQEAANIIQENQKLHAQCQEYEKMDEELNLKISRLTAEVREAQRDYARLLLESKLLERVKRENREPRPV
ncbi:hypothetical protein DH2020_042727 [Rehmannia glutinosa]|uniref:Morc S5 domain-containing protein n=1 Tax=Rehmannia glutinosa TaxID=99300 RepID=A0ABR0UMZ7_REHGL